VSAGGVAFREGHVETGGVRIRYLEAGQGVPLVHLHGAGGLSLTPAHDLLARRFRVVACEIPTLDAPDPHGGAPGLAATIGRATETIGLGPFNLVATSSAAAPALWLALGEPARVLALVLESPETLRPRGSPASSRSDDAAARCPRDGELDLEGRLPGLATPTLVLLGTQEGVPAAMGRVCTALMPRGHLVFVYGAGRDIASDRPEAFVEVVADFLERHDAFVIRRRDARVDP
jgi:pimeloyl-ACP methyl ester carboxylesterase